MPFYAVTVRSKGFDRLLVVYWTYLPFHAHVTYTWDPPRVKKEISLSLTHGTYPKVKKMSLSPFLSLTGGPTEIKTKYFFHTQALSLP